MQSYRWTAELELAKNLTQEALEQLAKFKRSSISLEMVLPGEKRNERITLNDFNLRHLIHGQQQGMGSLYYTRYPRKSDHVQGGVGSSVKGAGEHVSLAFKDGEDEFTTIQNLSFVDECLCAEQFAQWFNPSEVRHYSRWV